MFKKAAVFTDIHFGLKGNSKVHNDDCEEFIDWFIQTAKEQNCDVAIFCGDWHHNRNSLNLSTMDATIRSIEKLGKAFNQTYLFVGNHDMYYKDKRDVSSTIFSKHIPGVTLVDKIMEVGDVAFVPWLVGNEWKKIQNIKSKYMFGHFELPHFYMNAMVKMPDHGELTSENFKNQKYVFSGHFHKRQKQGNISYIGNAFPHNYADAWDDDRGMMVIDFENDGEPEYFNWEDAPKYRTITLSQLLDNTEEIMKTKMYLRVTLDIPISYEEASFIKETFMSQYGCREITLIPQKLSEEISTDLDISAFESVDQIVANEIAQIDTSSFNKVTLLDIYNGLNQ